MGGRAPSGDRARRWARRSPTTPPGERLARVAHASGIPLAPEFEPKAIRKAILKKVKTDATISRRVGDPSAEFMTAEELAKMRREARAKARSRAPTT